MRFKFFSVLAAVALLAACETAPESSGNAQSSGATASTSSGSGAPMAKVQIPAGSQEDLVVNVGDRVFFAFDSSDLSAEARASLEKQAAWMKKFGGVRVVIEGHCDERGTREYNLALGERRANASKDYLVALGINPARIKTISYGKERPAALGHNETAWAQNRRGVTVVDSTGS
ncbi:peptidoglycan-associated lipoprotein Pal [Thalassospiraceae bacterium LMO-JJ14]|nr:peptidoglycan-associated lipoprotein Pal [Thalassospiraceae bacterium LMO-JJ14]